MSVTQDGVWLHFDLGAPLRVLSWSLTNPGLVTSNAMVWREVKNSDLTPDLDVNDWYGRALDETSSVCCHYKSPWLSGLTSGAAPF